MRRPEEVGEMSLDGLGFALFRVLLAWVCPAFVVGLGWRFIRSGVFA